MTVLAFATLGSTTEIGSFLIFVALSIDIESLQNRLLKVCHLPATSTRLPGLLFIYLFIFAAINSTNKANKADSMCH
jgi:hypothetical protein